MSRFLRSENRLFENHSRASLWVAGLLFVLVALPVSADLMVVQSTQTKGPGASGEGDTTMYIKGLKMRQEQQVKGHKMISILDIENKQSIIIDERKKKAEIYDLSSLAQQQVALGTDGLTVTLEATGDSKTVAGEDCKVHEAMIKVHVDASQSGGMPIEMDVVVEGPVCLVPNSPGVEDYQRFFAAMAEAGLFLGDPRVAETQAGHQKGFSELYRSMSEKGLAYESDLTVGFEGSGFMAKMLSKMSFETESMVKSISTEPLADALFEVPADVKVKRVK